MDVFTISIAVLLSPELLSAAVLAPPDISRFRRLRMKTVTTITRAATKIPTVTPVNRFAISSDFLYWLNTEKVVLVKMRHFGQ